MAPRRSLDKSQRQAARRSSAAFRRAAKHVAEERKLRQAAGGPPDIKAVEVLPEIADFEYINPESEVVLRAMDLIRPTDRPEPRCRSDLALMMARVRVYQRMNSLPNLGPIKDQIKDVAKALKRTKRAIVVLPRSARVAQSIYWGDFCNLLDEVLKTVERHHDGIVPGKGCRPLDAAKSEAADAAFYAITRWKRARPTKTVDGVFYELASVIYEGGTGIQGA
jgi:hypothetical protein